jgi:hypothetical protein
VPAVQKLRTRGGRSGLRHHALGETRSLRRRSTRNDRYGQVCYNLLNPSAGTAVPAGFTQDFGGLLNRTRERRVGVVVIRVLAAAAQRVDERSIRSRCLGGSDRDRADYRTDVATAQKLGARARAGRVRREPGRSVDTSGGGIGCGVGDPGRLSEPRASRSRCGAAVNRGPLPAAALERLGALWSGLA